MELSSPTSPASASSKRGRSSNPSSRCAGSSAGHSRHPLPAHVPHVGRRRTARTVRVSAATDVCASVAVNISGCGAGRWPCFSLRDSMRLPPLAGGRGRSHLRRGAGSLRVAPSRWDEHVSRSHQSRLLVQRR
eukprot:7378917-Prymnesium_polylepis.1